MQITRFIISLSTVSSKILPSQTFHLTGRFTSDQIRQDILETPCQHKHLIRVILQTHFGKGIFLFYLPQATCLLWHQYSYSYPSVHAQEAWYWLDSNRSGNFPAQTEASSHTQVDSHRPPEMYDQINAFVSKMTMILVLILLKYQELKIR